MCHVFRLEERKNTKEYLQNFVRLRAASDGRIGLTFLGAIPLLFALRNKILIIAAKVIKYFSR